MAARKSKVGTARKKSTDKSPNNRRKKPAKLGFTITVDLPIVGNTRKAKIGVAKMDGTIAMTDRADLGDSRERTRLANKLTKQLQRGPAEQWEAALQQAYLKAVEECEAAKQVARENPPPPDSPCSPGSMYRIEAGRICMTRHTMNGEEIVIPLCNFTAFVTEAIRVDDGSGDIEQFFTVEGTLDSGTVLPPTSIRAAEFMLLTWPVTCWGLRAIVTPGQGYRDHLRAAIQWLSGRAIERTVYKHTGWRKINDEWVFLHALGAITTRGLNKDIAVDLGPLAYFALPVPPTGDDLKNAVRASLRLLDLPHRLIIPILGQVWRAVLGNVEWSQHVVGHTGLGKSEIVALGQQHFGKEMHRLNLPASWQSTGNALVELSFLAKDCVLTVDDFKPAGSKYGIDQMHQLAERVLRAQGNHSGRARCRADGTVKSPRPPRATILSSGEDVPRHESLRARIFTRHVSKGEIDVCALTPFQQDAVQGRYAAAMSAYLCWLAPRLDSVTASLAEDHALLRSKAMSSGGHARTPGIVADLALGWKRFLQFAVEEGVITNDERDQIAREVWDALLNCAAEQEKDIAEQDPAFRFLKLLNATLTSGRAHVTDRDGQAPTNATMWGWREDDGNGEDRCALSRPQGRQVGWVDGDDLFLDVEAVFAEVQRLGEDQGERLALSKTQLCRHMKEIDLLRSFETDKTTTRRTLQGREHAVLHLAAGSLIPEKQGERGEQGAEMPNVPPIPPVPPVSGRDEVVL